MLVLTDLVNKKNLLLSIFSFVVLSYAFVAWMTAGSTTPNISMVQNDKEWKVETLPPRVVERLVYVTEADKFSDLVPEYVARKISRLYHQFKANGSLVNDLVTSDDPIIPNIYHYIRFNQSFMKFYEMLSIKSVLKVAGPDYVYIHCNEAPAGEFWDLIKDDARLKIMPLEPPKSIFGKEYGWIQHGSDVARIQMILKYGGIYMDNDCVVINDDMERLRKHHCVVSKSSKENAMGNMFMMGTIDCVFFKLALELYKLDYRRDGWYYNGGELPQHALIDPYPGLVYLADEGVEQGMMYGMWGTDLPVSHFQKQYRVLHLFYGHKDYTYNDTTAYNMENIKTKHNSFSRIARWLIYDHEEPYAV